MTYLALGDSISIDDYTEVKGGGAASQLARLLKADPFIDRTKDGMTTDGLLNRDLGFGEPPVADCVTLTIGGNDLLGGFFTRSVGDRSQTAPQALERTIQNLETIGGKLAAMRCPVILNTIYDPTDGDDEKAAELDLPPEARQGFFRTNQTLVRIAAERGFLLCDLEALFRGHGFWSNDPWLVMHIEPGLRGATEIAKAWHDLFTSKGKS